jgi:hypothetical protein
MNKFFLEQFRYKKSPSKILENQCKIEKQAIKVQEIKVQEIKVQEKIRNTSPKRIRSASPPKKRSTSPKRKRQQLGAAKREQVWEVYATKFMLKYKEEKWFQKLNPPDRIYTTITCWCCDKILISEKGYGDRSLFEAGHVDAHCYTKNDNIENLRPICRNCNLKMGTTNMLEFAMYMGYKSEITKE